MVTTYILAHDTPKVRWKKLILSMHIVSPENMLTAMTDADCNIKFQRSANVIFRQECFSRGSQLLFAGSAMSHS